MSNDVSLFLGLATATATALGAAVALGLLRPDRTSRGRRERALASVVLLLAVLGIGSALIAVGKGHTTRGLTWLMFIGLSAPAVFALARAFSRIIGSRRYATLAWVGSMASVLALLAVSSPGFFSDLFSGDDGEPVVKITVADRSDPNMSGCSPTGRAIPGTRVDVVDEDLHYGVIYLKHSPACDTIWARVDGLPNELPAPMHFTLRRGNQRVTKTMDAIEDHYEFTDQLKVRATCVQGEFSYGDGRALARTPCVDASDVEDLPADPAIPAPPDAAPPAVTVTELQGSIGVGTYSNPHRRRQDGQRVPPFARVEVSCKVWTRVPEAGPHDGYMYRLASPPWANRYYAPALSFWNGDKPGERATHFTDWHVPNC